jgi:hypothetical protein
MASGIFTQRQVQRETLKGSWVNPKVPSVEYLVIAGGGAGGNSIGGGGGAGGLLQGHVSVASGTPITVTVGAGGSNNSGVNSAFSSIIATGGGRGGSYLDEIGRPGGSGGGGSGRETPSINANGGSGIGGQGNPGGRGFPLNTNYTGAGGGGAGTIGRNAVNNYAGLGGDGIASEISGNRTVYAGGGGGGTHPTGTAGVGGSGGGGAGTASGGGTGVAGTANLGAGGGGSTYNQANGGTGGSGVVIISYPDTYANAASQTNGTFSTTGSGSISFNGSTNHLTYGDQGAFEFGSGDFTIETYIYVNSLSAGGSIIGKYRIASVADSEFFIGYSTSGTLYIYLDSTVPSYDETGFVSGTGVITTGNWIHVAVTRSSNTVRVFANGSVVASGAYSRTINSSGTPLRIGALTNTSDDYSNFINAYISNVRIVKGTALYTDTFVPSTTPLTAVSGTSLLLPAVSGSYLTDISTNGFTPVSSTSAVNNTIAGNWNQASPFATGLGYKDRVYTWTSSGTITF